MLSGELATLLAGRYVEFAIYPFHTQSFLESPKRKQQGTLPRIYAK